MASTLLEEVVAGRAPTVARFTVEQVHRMIEVGILPDASPVELIEGVLVHKDRADAGDGTLSHGKRHRLAVKNLIRLERRLPSHVHLLVQLPVALTPMSEPEPDAAIVRGTPGEYADRNPGPADLLVVIEVSDSSLSYDRTTKLQLYAQAAIATYWILNTREGRLEVYTEPVPAEGRYAARSDLGPGDAARLDLGNGATLEVLVATLLNA